MVSLSKLSVSPPRRQPRNEAAPAIDPGLRELVTHLRLVALECRTAARADLFEACALLNLDGETAKRTFAETLVKCLATAVSKQVIWYRPGVAELSFDEAWILRCVQAVRQDDQSSLRFLLGSRVAPPDRRYIGFLIAHISEQFCLD
ncbi:hypothetical protein [uncultured Roseobacter sp.]|uniref:hypothetical protein n=1 Tax=uncultured Roseobacter sp. TaxID=114847 RepID=UPI002636A490|nr:hypothetical protein [uncultured Roseobacter sp.]